MKSKFLEQIMLLNAKKISQLIEVFDVKFCAKEIFEYINFLIFITYNNHIVHINKDICERVA